MSGFPRSGGGASTFPLTNDGGTTTEVVEAAGLAFPDGARLAAQLDADPGLNYSEYVAASSAGTSAATTTAIGGAGALQSRIGVSSSNTGTASITLETGGNNHVRVTQDAAGRKLGFYGAAPVLRAAHPVTLADVITALTNLGLTS